MSKANKFYQNTAEQRKTVAMDLIKENQLLKQQRDKLLEACKKAEAALVNRDENEMMQAQCICTAAIAEAEKGC